MSNAPLKHIVFISAPYRSHLSAIAKTVVRLVDKFPDLFICSYRALISNQSLNDTPLAIFVNSPQAPQLKEDITKQTSAHVHRIQIVPSSTTKEAADVDADHVKTLAGLEHAFRDRITAQLEYPSTEIAGLTVDKPSWIVEDLVTGGVALSCKDDHGLPMIAWWFGPASALVARLGNEKNGHGSRVLRNMADRRAQGEQILTENATTVFLKEISDRLVYIPGIPAHYEHEQITQLNPLSPPPGWLTIGRWMNIIQNVDYLACCTAYEMEPIPATALAQGLLKPLTPFFIGPPVDLPSSTAQSKPTTPIFEFLDRAYTELGPHSVIYVAFGTTVFPFPSSFGHFTIILEEIIAKGFRLVCALPLAKSSSLSSEWVDKLTQSGNAIFPEWTDQTAVLEHPAIHYFLSHGGWASSIEALLRGVPMIFWPFKSDQPTNTMQIATIHNAGFELLQVRSGPARKTAYRNGTDVIIKGTDDAVRDEIKHVLEMSRAGHQRLNARLLGQMLARSLAPGGSADVGLEKFGKLMGLGSA